MIAEVPPFLERTERDGKVSYKVNFHKGQQRVMLSMARFVVALGGRQSGKTVTGPHWIYREIQRRGSGDYLVVSPTYPLLSKKVYPEFIKWFKDTCRLGEFTGRGGFDSRFLFSPRGCRALWGRVPDEPTQIFFGHAQNADSLESATAKAAWLDECVAPGTMIETEIGPLRADEIVRNRLRLRVWSFDAERGAWELRPIVRWIRLPQNRPLARFGPLRATADHRVWTSGGYEPLGIILSGSANSTEVERIENVKVLRFLREGIGGSASGEVLQLPMRHVVSMGGSGVSSKGDGEDQRGDGRRGVRGYFYRQEEVPFRSGQPGKDRPGETQVLRRSGQPALVSTGRGTVETSEGFFQEAIEAGETGPALGEGWERPADQLASTDVGGCVGERMALRIPGGDGGEEERFSDLLQDRRGSPRFEDCRRGREQGEPAEATVVCGEWVDASAFHQHDGGELVGGVSEDGCVYNLEVEGNHNYVADGILVANCGQKSFRLASYEAIRGRLAIYRGRCLMTTTPYVFGWLKQQLYDKWKAGDKSIDVIRFDSTENPAFSKEEFEDLRNSMPTWKFNLFYRAMFEKPAGVIYEDFISDRSDPECQVIDPCPLPDWWPRYVGLDFGGLHTAATFFAGEMDHQNNPTGRYILYREYPERGSWAKLTCKGHAEKLRKDEPPILKAFGGSPGEGNWRDEFRQAGLAIQDPGIKDVEVGIDRVTRLIKEKRLFVFSTCTGFLDEIGGYSRKLDANDEPTDEIDDKSSYHYLDSARYAATHLAGEKKTLWVR